MKYKLVYYFRMRIFSRRTRHQREVTGSSNCDVDIVGVPGPGETSPPAVVLQRCPQQQPPTDARHRRPGSDGVRHPRSPSALLLGASDRLPEGRQSTIRQHAACHPPEPTTGPLRVEQRQPSGLPRQGRLPVLLRLPQRPVLGRVLVLSIDEAIYRT